jgi:aspartate carbamoyltransferase regulatory subunit
MLKTVSVSAIKQGTVIDHIQPGVALRIAQILRLAADEKRVTIGLNLKSPTRGLKDLIKIENFTLTEAQASHIALLSPNATICLIENYRVVRKYTPTLPVSVSSLLSCPSPRCVTHQERITTLFFIDASTHRITLRCKYCEASFTREEI